MEWLEKLKFNYKKIKEKLLNELKNSFRMKIFEGEKLDFGKLSEKIKEKYCLYEENIKDFKMVDFVLKVIWLSGIVVLVVIGLVLVFLVVLVGGSVISIGLGIYFNFWKLNMKFKLL